METSKANCFCGATAESLSTVSATTDSCDAGEAVASEVGAGEMEKEKGQEIVLSRNVPELKQDLRHIEAEQGKREEQKKLDQVLIPD